MDVLVVADPAEMDTGFVGDRLRHHGARLRFADRGAPDDLARGPGRADLVLLLGSDRSVHDPHHEVSVAGESELVRRCAEEGRPVLGICYGGQLIARASGSVVGPAARPEIGWVAIDTDDDRLAPEGPWFQFHADRWWPAPDQQTLARTACGPQAFRWARALALQFHPEVTVDTASRWIKEAPGMVLAAGADPDRLLEELPALVSAAEARCARLVDDFLTRVAGPADLDDPTA